MHEKNLLLISRLFGASESVVLLVRFAISTFFFVHFL